MTYHQSPIVFNVDPGHSFNATIQSAVAVDNREISAKRRSSPPKLIQKGSGTARRTPSQRLLVILYPLNPGWSLRDLLTISLVCDSNAEFTFWYLGNVLFKTHSKYLEATSWQRALSCVVLQQEQHWSRIFNHSSTICQRSLKLFSSLFNPKEKNRAQPLMVDIYKYFFVWLGRELSALFQFLITL